MDPKDLYTSGTTNFLIALTSLITAIGVVWVNIIVAKAKTKVAETAEAVIRRADEIGETTKTTLGHVNSAATEMRDAIKALQVENDRLRQTMSENKETAAVLAATNAAEKQAALLKQDAPQGLNRDTLSRIEAGVKDISEHGTKVARELLDESKRVVVRAELAKQEAKLLERIETNTAETVQAVKESATIGAPPAPTQAVEALRTAEAVIAQGQAVIDREKGAS